MTLEELFFALIGMVAVTYLVSLPILLVGLMVAWLRKD